VATRAGEVFENLPLRRLIGILLALDLLAIFGLVRPLRLTSHYPGEPLGLFDIIGHTPGSAWRFTFLALALVALFVAAYQVALRLPSPQLGQVIVAGSGVLVFTCLFLYPATSNDLFHYVMEARIFWVHHADPFTVAPMAYPNDPFALWIVWYDLPSPYGPAWIFLTGLPLLLGHGDLIWTLITFKLLAVAFYFLAGFCIYRIVRITRPGHEWPAALLWLWNPLIVMYVAGNGANDAIMMGLTLLSLYLGVRGRWRLAFPLLALATLVKFVSAVLIPIIVLYAVLTTPRQKWRVLIESLAVSAGIGILLYAPFWHGMETLTTLRYQASQFTDSPPALLMNLLSTVWTQGRSEAFTKLVSYTLFACAYLLIARYLFLRRQRLGPDELVIACFAVICAYTMLSVFWFQPWYLIWIISLGALNGGVRAKLTLLFTLAGFMTHTATAIAALKGWYYTNGYFDPIREEAIVVAMVYVAPALLVGLTLLQRSTLWPPIARRLDRVARRLVAGTSPGKLPAAKA
jgi:hypothetical protein